jgi:hypothetical protein
MMIQRRDGRTELLQAKKEKKRYRKEEHDVKIAGFVE